VRCTEARGGGVCQVEEQQKIEEQLEVMAEDVLAHEEVRAEEEQRCLRAEQRVRELEAQLGLLHSEPRGASRGAEAEEEEDETDEDLGEEPEPSLKGELSNDIEPEPAPVRCGRNHACRICYAQ
jgi:hypothetical protein